MTLASKFAARRKKRPRSGAQLPAGIPLPPVEEEHFLRREAVLLLFCAAFAATVFGIWKSVEQAFLEGFHTEVRRPIENLKDILVPFLTAYVAARLYTSMLRFYERQLERERVLLAHIMETSADGIVTLDANDQISTWNRGAEHIFGYSEKEILGKHASVLYLPGREGMDELAELRRAVERTGFVRSHTGQRVKRDRTVISTEISTTVIRDEQGRYVGRASIFRDVTERDRIRAEMARRESLAAIGEMAAAVAHEIKNPLAGIGGAVQVIGRAFAAADPRAEVVEEIQSQVRRLDETIRDLLTFARPTVPRYAELEFKGFMDRILSVLGKVPELQPLTVEVDVPDDLQVTADPQLLENIIVNLLLNAGQAMGGREGRIVVTARGGPEETRITVADEGQGITEEVLAKLFKPFFTTRARGSGLGLTITRKFVEVMGGRIDLETEVGKGSSFTVVLPRHKETRSA
jgi:PAS domain S-box-containing protein